MYILHAHISATYLYILIHVYTFIDQLFPATNSFFRSRLDLFATLSSAYPENISCVNWSSLKLGHI